MSTPQRTEIKPHAEASGFPLLAYIQRFDEVPPDYMVVAEELKARGIPIVYKRTEDLLTTKWALTKQDLVVGNFDWTRLALEKLNVPMPSPPDYPECLRHLLNRRVWHSTLGEVQQFLHLQAKQPSNEQKQIFIKPANTAKLFAAIIEPKDQMLDILISGIPDVLEGLPLSTSVFCSEVVDMVNEYRVYVVEENIRSICQYRGSSESSDNVKISMEVAQKAVDLLSKSSEGKELVGYAMDLAVVQQKEGVYTTCLVEVNDGYSLGRYEGISGKDYTDLLIARWKSLVKL